MPSAPQENPRSLRHAATEFAESWASATDEKQSAQSYWSSFFRKVIGLDDLRDAGIEFEYRVRSHLNGAMRWIDVFLPGVLLIEHKSAGKSLDKAEEQAREYLASLPLQLRPQHVIVCDFQKWRLIDVAANQTLEFALAELPEHVGRIEAILAKDAVDIAEVQAEADKKAAALMTALYKELEAANYDQHSTNILLSRLLFLMFSDDMEAFPRHGVGLFHEYLLDSNEDGSDLGGKLSMLFSVLNTPVKDRQTTLPEHLKKFPYVNGGIFSEPVLPPAFNKSMRTALLNAAAYDWSAIDSAIFGSLFQQVKSKKDRHQGGEHYTSEKDILKSLRPLFLDELEERMWAAWLDARALESLRQELGRIRVLDAACGSGNYLIVAFRELRNLEIQIIARTKQLNGTFGSIGLIPDIEPVVRLENFFGIEIEEWPSTIARTAMHLTDQQMNLELDTITGLMPVRFPLTHSANIVNANALQIDWNEICPNPDRHTFVVGNPPFLGSTYQSPEQKADQKRVWGNVRGSGAIDFVANWHLLAARYIAGRDAKAALLSTNSITQGEQPAVLGGQWKSLGVSIDFAHRTFVWNNGAAGKAAIHCVVIGFSSNPKPSTLHLWEYPDIKGAPVRREVKCINAYLVDGPAALITPRRTPFLVSTSIMDNGSKPTDGGHLSNISADEAEQIRQNDPIAAKYLRRLIGAEELVRGTERYCLWLVGAEVSDIRNSPEIRKRAGAVREMRAGSTKAMTRKDAETPTLFQENRQPSERYLAVPKVTSEKRDYLQTAYFDPETIINDRVQAIPAAGLDVFGLISSKVFTFWNATVSGRLKSDFNVSAEITYNNFPWPEFTGATKAVVEAAAQAVLDARALYPNSSLADLYDPLAMPSELRKAHRDLDKAVLSAYGLPADATDAEILEHLFTRYAELARDASETKMSA